MATFLRIIRGQTTDTIETIHPPEFICSFSPWCFHYWVKMAVSTILRPWPSHHNNQKTIPSFGEQVWLRDSETQTLRDSEAHRLKDTKTYRLRLSDSPRLRLSNSPRLRLSDSWSEDCFYYYWWRNNVVVLFGTLKVQSFIFFRPHVQAWLSWSERGTVNP